MKLASLKNGRDGKLVVVSRDLTRFVDASPVAPTLQSALDQWSSVAPELAELYRQLNQDAIPSSDFNPQDCASPLPRAYQWADGSAYVNHVELVRKARGAEMPSSFWEEPLMYQGGSDTFLSPNDPICFDQAQSWGVDFEAEIAVFTDDVPMSVSRSDAESHIKLLALVNDVSLRGLIPDELAKGFGFFQSKPSSAFSPVCVTPDELGDAWTSCKVHLPLLSFLNRQKFGMPNAGQDMTFDFAELIAHAAKSRQLGAGTIIGSGTVSNKLNGEPGKPISEGGVGYSCIAEVRMIETLTSGQAETRFLQHGDNVQIEMLDRDGQSVFGRIDQDVILKSN